MGRVRFSIFVEYGRIEPYYGRKVDLSLNIKSSEAHNLAREIAKSTGESLTEAVTQSLRERLARVRNSDKGLADRLVRIGKDCARHLKGRSRSVTYDDLLYDEKGLPR